jgi:hypothetical protein
MFDVMKMSAGAGDARKWMRERLVSTKATNKAIQTSAPTRKRQHRGSTGGALLAILESFRLGPRSRHREGRSCKTWRRRAAHRSEQMTKPTARSAAGGIIRKITAFRHLLRSTTRAVLSFIAEPIVRRKRGACYDEELELFRVSSGLSDDHLSSLPLSSSAGDLLLLAAISETRTGLPSILRLTSGWRRRNARLAASFPDS